MLLADGMSCSRFVGGGLWLAGGGWLMEVGRVVGRMGRQLVWVDTSYTTEVSASAHGRVVIAEAWPSRAPSKHLWPYRHGRTCTPTRTRHKAASSISWSLCWPGRQGELPQRRVWRASALATNQTTNPASTQVRDSFSLDSIHSWESYASSMAKPQGSPHLPSCTPPQPLQAKQLIHPPTTLAALHNPTPSPTSVRSSS